jgi:hypothetical protein
MTAMAYGSQDTARAPGGLAHAVTTFFESIGLLNKGSADAKAVPDASEAAKIQPIVSNSLNVTRVGGLAALVTSVGAAALAIFNVKKTDPAMVVMAAYLGAGAIVVAALLAAAIIISADVRARTAVAVAHSPDTQTPTAPPSAAAPQNHQATATFRPGAILPQVQAPLSPALSSPALSSPALSSPDPQVSPAASATDHVAPPVPQSWALYAIDNWDWPTARMLTATLDLWKVPYDHRDQRLAVHTSFAPLIDSLVKNFSLPVPIRLPS